MDRAQQVVADRSLGKGKQQCLIDRSGGTLSRWVELANGLDFVAEELNAEGPVCLWRINVKDATANGILARHLHYVSGRIADSIQMAQQRFGIERVAAANQTSQIGVVLGRAK